MTVAGMTGRVFGGLDGLAPAVLPTMARAVFAAVLAGYYGASALTKFGDGIGGLLRPSAGAYVQILPRSFEAAGYDASALSPLHHLIVLAGTWGEILLPALIVLGLLTRVAAAGMIGFIIVQSVVDVIGHGVSGADLGAWFDARPASLILDQRAMWITVLSVPLFLGAGPLSLDRLVRRYVRKGASAASSHPA